MRCQRLLTLVIPVLVFAGLSLQTNAQTTPDWETFHPEGEEFQVLMPKGPQAQIGTTPYHKMELTTRMYLSGDQKGPMFAIVSLSGIKSNPALYSDYQRLNSYVDAFKSWFPEQAVGKGAVAKLTLVGEKNLAGNTGREYRMTVGQLSGLVQTYATKKRFYAALILNTKEDQSLQDRFLSSFLLPEKIAEPPANIAKQPEPARPGQPAAPGQPSSDVVAAPSFGTQASKQNVDTQKPDTGENPATDKKPENATGEPKTISGGVLNGRALFLPKPEYPGNDVSGTVVVQVVIDEIGAVISAQAVAGPAQLHEICVNAARLAKFSPTQLMGKPVKVSGVLTYNFVVSKP